MKSRNIIESFNYAVSGIIYALKTQRNMKIHFFIAIVVLCISLFLDFSRIEFLILLFTIGLVIITEMINTSIEKTIDLITEKFHPIAKVAKNVAAGAVLISAINAIIVGYLLFFDRLSSYYNLVLYKIKNSSVHLTFVALVLVTLFIIVIKTKFQSGTPFRGGIVSGHAAISFCAATIIAFIGKNFLIFTLSYFIALLVGESRIEGKIHSISEVMMGALLGTLIGLLIFQIIG